MKIGLVLSLGIRFAIVEAYHVPTGSMIPTVMEKWQDYAQQVHLTLCQETPKKAKIGLPQFLRRGMMTL